MQPEILGRIFKGFGANAYGQMVTVVVQLLGVPILLHAWGSQLYGEWLLLFAIPTYLSITDLGFSQSAANDMTARVALADRAGALAVFQSLAVLVYSVAGAGLVLTAILVPYISVHDWLHFEAMDADTTRWVLWLLAAQIFVGLPDGVNHAGFRAVGDYALHYGLYSTTRLLQSLTVWLAALGGAGPIAAAWIMFGVRAVATLICAALLTRRQPWLRLGLVHARWAEVQRLLQPALANIAIPAAQALNIQGMVLVVGAVLGPVAVVVFSTLRTLTRLASQLVSAIAHAFEPELAAAYGAGDRTLMRSLFVNAVRGGVWLSLTAAFGLAIYGSVILRIWTHGQVAMDKTLFNLLLASSVASALWYVALTVLKAANRHTGAATLFMTFSVLAVGAAFSLMSITGSLASAGVSLLISDAIMGIVTWWAAAKFVGVSPLALAFSAGNPLGLLKYRSQNWF